MKIISIEKSDENKIVYFVKYTEGLFFPSTKTRTVYVKEKANLPRKTLDIKWFDNSFFVPYKLQEKIEWMFWNNINYLEG